MMIRRAEEKDIPRVSAMLSEILELHAALRPDIFIPGTVKYGPAELTAIFRDENTPVYVAVDENDTAVGYAFCAIREPSSHSNMVPHRSFYLDDLCVEESMRGKHIGEALYRHVLAEAARLGCYNVTLNVWAGNAAERFYQKMGMKPQRTVMEYILKEGE